MYLCFESDVDDVDIRLYIAVDHCLVVFIMSNSGVVVVIMLCFVWYGSGRS